MLFRLGDKILFRQYGAYGYLTDNSKFGYHFLNDIHSPLSAKIVSQSGSVMLGMLSRTYQEFDDIVRKLSDIFIGVDYDVLRQDTFDFFGQLTLDGYLDCSETLEESEVSPEKDSSSGFGQEQKEFQDNLLLSLHIEIASTCNERCVHCFIPHNDKTRIMTPELFRKILDEGRAMNIIHVTLTGGEPLMHPNILDFLRKCRELDLSVNVLTNLTLLTDEIISEMKKNAMLSVQTSLYSMRPSVHDAITNLPGSFEKTKSGIMRLIQAGIPVQVSCQVMKQNKDTFGEVMKWAEANNLPATFNCIIFGEYDRSNQNLRNRLTVQELGEAYSTQVSDEDIRALRKSAEIKASQGGEAPICSVCRYYFGITAEGDVFPCAGWQSKKLGNLAETSIREIWETSPEVNFLRSVRRKDFPKCVTCRDRGYCTVCMMTNSNENPDGDMFRVSCFQCEAAAMLHSISESAMKESN